MGNNRQWVERTILPVRDESWNEWRFVDSIPGFWDALNSVKQIAVEHDHARPKKLDSIKPVNTFLSENITYADLLGKEELSVLDSLLSIYPALNVEKMNLNPNFLLINLQIGIAQIESWEWAKEMVQSLESMLEDSIAGAGHLAGEKGVINLLKERGYFVKSVKPS